MAEKGSRRRGSAPRPKAAPPPRKRTWAEPAWTVPTARVVAALGVLALAVFALAAHPIGDHFTESDFYEYAAGARGIAGGVVDFGRYGVVGPVYEMLLAVSVWLEIPMFLFARLLSVASIAVVLFAWLEIVRRHASGLAALVAVTLLACNAVLFRYGYSSTTDAPALAFQAISLFALLAWRGRAAPWVAGATAALAVLTRYNAAYLIPGAAVYLLVWAEGPPAVRRATLARWLAGFAIIAGPWTVASTANGHWPAESLLTNRTFFTSTSATQRNAQDSPQGLAGREERAPADTPGASAPAPGLVSRVVANVPSHLRDDARQVLGWPTAALCALGLVLILAERRARVWLPLGFHGALAFLSLAPVFYSDRYSLAVLPFYLSLAGAAAASPYLASSAGRSWWLVPVLLAGWPLADSLGASVRLQRVVSTQLPRDVLAAASTLRRERQPDDGLIARKGALAFHADVRAVAFPRLESIAALAAYARENRARFLYYSWYEGMLRPEYWYLLDTATTVPGLVRIASVASPAAVLFRIEEGFGADPEWMADSTRRFVHIARGQLRVLEDRDAWSAHAFLAREARLAGRWAEALGHLEAMARGRPGDARAWVYAGDARVALGDPDGARSAYDRALAINPRSLGAQLGVGWTHYARQRYAEAASAWRPVIDGATDARTLDAMIDAFDRSDPASAERARRARATLPAATATPQARR